MKRGYTENVAFVDDVTAGVATHLSFEGDSLIVKKTYDATPHLEHARRMRESQDGKTWGQGRYVGHIPPVEYARIMALPSRQEREKATYQWLRDNPAFVGFTRFLKR